MRTIVKLLILALIWGFMSCQKSEMPLDADAQGHTAPTEYTIKSNQAVRESLPLNEQQSFSNAKRGLVATTASLTVTQADGNVIWDQPARDFIQGEAPNSVNPSLWRQAKLNNLPGLFRVTEGVYQLRNFDLSNMTLIKGKTGWIVVDPLTSAETAGAAMALAKSHLDVGQISAIIFTHSHVDHFAGVLGVVSIEEVRKDAIRIIAPDGFMHEATSENVLAGVAMGRRAGYMTGRYLAKSKRGHVDTGLGQGLPFGTLGILQPTEIINKTPQYLVVDGVNFIFQNVPDSEAPAELTFYLPDLKAFCGGEIINHTMHNLYTLRGAKVRDALRWSNYIQEAINIFGSAEVYFGTHHWPVWGNENIIEFLKKQRDIYKYIHDQTLRLANKGFTPREIADQITFPESLRTTFSNRGYYGTLRHNSRAVYQHYFGWYDGNPANLNPLPPVESGTRYIKLMGGAENVIKNAQDAFDRGEYRWVAELLNHLVFAEPDNEQGKALLARAYDQLGYQSESGVWRDVYLTAAYELRHGKPKTKGVVSGAWDLLKQIPIPRFLDAMAAALNGPKADGKNITINVIFTDLNETYVLQLENAVLHHRKGNPDPKANATIKLTHDLYLSMAVGNLGIKDLILSNDIEFQGSKIDLIRFFTLMDFPKGSFNIVTP
jgi:alkyl sulfatase BDS1-like metallo-beta-lactamase superfamily hydrolase